jgi:hypothetical protein
MARDLTLRFGASPFGKIEEWEQRAVDLIARYWTAVEAVAEVLRDFSDDVVSGKVLRQVIKESESSFEAAASCLPTN